MNALSNETKLKIEKTIKNLKANKMDAYYCDNKEDACNLVKTLIKKGDVISSGGSVTLKKQECMILLLLPIISILTERQRELLPKRWKRFIIRLFLPMFTLRAVMRLQKTENCIMLTAILTVLRQFYTVLRVLYLFAVIIKL